jgi:hypothetical protein
MEQDSVDVKDMKIGDSFIVEGKSVKLISKSRNFDDDHNHHFETVFSLKFEGNNDIIEKQGLSFADKFPRYLAKIDNKSKEEEKKSPDEITVKDMQIGHSYLLENRKPRKLISKSITISTIFSKKKRI